MWVPCTPPQECPWTPENRDTFQDQRLYLHVLHFCGTRDLCGEMYFYSKLGRKPLGCDHLGMRYRQITWEAYAGTGQWTDGWNRMSKVSCLSNLSESLFIAMAPANGVTVPRAG